MSTAAFSPASFVDLPEFGVAHTTHTEAGTGCTVCVVPHGATCGVDVRGGAPATRETDLLRPDNTVEHAHGVVISGGSAFGLEAACGVMDVLAEAKHGFELAGQYVPIVPSACLFDLPVGSPCAPDKTAGAEAALLALKRVGTDYTLEQGNVGAGTGATVGKFLQPQNAMKGGFGWAGVKAGPLVAMALVAVNALGNVRSSDGRWLAGAHIGDRIVSVEEAFAMGGAPIAEGAPCTNTTLGVILTNAALTKAQAQRVATMTHDAYARAIWPVHTTNDGDTIFALASGQIPTAVDVIGALACNAMQAAIESAAVNATSAYGLIAARDLTSLS